MVTTFALLARRVSRRDSFIRCFFQVPTPLPLNDVSPSGIGKTWSFSRPAAPRPRKKNRGETTASASFLRPRVRPSPSPSLSHWLFRVLYLQHANGRRHFFFHPLPFPPYRTGNKDGSALLPNNADLLILDRWRLQADGSMTRHAI